MLEHSATEPVDPCGCRRSDWEGGVLAPRNGDVVFAAPRRLDVPATGDGSAHLERGRSGLCVVDRAHLPLCPDADVVVLVGEVDAAVIVVGL